MPEYKPLYPPEGAPCKGFACESCARVTRTARGMISHLRTVHKIELQFCFPLPESETKYAPKQKEKRKTKRTGLIIDKIADRTHEILREIPDRRMR